jgi:hypothetical protein
MGVDETNIFEEIPRLLKSKGSSRINLKNISKG